jgi:long-chain fatty acid transport protein
VRLGYNNGDSPIKNKTLGNADAAPGSANGNLGSDYGMSQFGVSYFNLIGFPAITEEHYTLGLGYKITGGFSIDFAYTYAPGVKVTHEGQNGSMLQGVKITGYNEQSAFTAALRYNF